MADVKEFTIDRTTWACGSRCLDTYLLGNSGSRCCLGFYAKACGVGDDDSIEVSSPDDIPILARRTLPAWLFDDDYVHDSSATCALINNNDDPNLGDAEREAKIAAGFAEQGITVHFVGEYPSE